MTKNIATMSVIELQSESTRLQSLLGDMQAKVGDVQAELNSIRAELNKRLRPSPEPRVSDHALLRYLERAKGVDVEAVRAEIMTPATIAAIKAGASAITVNGCKMPIKDGCIATVLAKEQRLKRRTQKGRVVDLDADADEEMAEAYDLP